MTTHRLRAVEPADYGPLRRFELDLTLGPRWRHRGATPSPEAFAAALWNGALAVYLVQGDHRPDPLGLVSAYGQDLQSGFAWVAAARFDPEDHPAPFLLGLRDFVDHLFATWPLRKLYAEVLAPNLEPFGSAVSLLVEQEGVLRDHAYLDGGFVDQHLLALTRRRWEERRHGVIGGVAAHEVPTLDRLRRAVEDLLDRPAGSVDVDLPLADQAIDSLGWLLVADHLERYLADPDQVTDLVIDHVTLRSMHRGLVDRSLAR
mgnify:FL=1